MGCLKKGIGLQMVAGMILALVGVVILIGLAANDFDFEKLRCSVSSKILLFLPHQGDLPPSPSGCPTAEQVRYEEIVVGSSDKNEVALIIAGAIVSCWDDFQGYGSEQVHCTSFSMKNLEEEIFENEINVALKGQGLCPGVIENNEVEFGGGAVCGNSNQIIFEIQSIKMSDFIIISYVGGAIHVI